MALLCAASVTVFSTPAFSEQADYLDFSPEQLLAAEVTSASRRPELLSDTPAAVYVITADDIQRSGATSIPDILRKAPGVNVAQADGNSWAVSIRGFNGVLANKLLVMVDGRTEYNPLFAGTYWEVQDLPLEDIQQIEIVRGPGGALWGANAVNGVINIITKNAAATQGTLISGALGTQQYRSTVARYGGTFGPENYYRIYGKAEKRGPYRTPSGEDSTDDLGNYRAGFRADGETYTLQGDVFNVLSTQNNTTPQLAAPFALTEEETMKTNGANLLGRWSRLFTDGGRVQFQTYVDYFKRDQILLEDERVIVDLDTQYNLPVYGNHEIIFGGGYRFTHDNLGNSPAITFTPDTRNDHLFNAFVQDHITLVPERWFLTLGTKIEHNDYSGIEIQPNARLMWNPTESQTLWTSVSRAVRTPSRLDHDLNQTIGVFAPGTLLPGLTEAVQESNDDLDAEKLVAYEAGYRNQLTEDLAIDAAVFYNDYDDLATIGFLPLRTGVNPARVIFPVTTTNGMEAQAYGFEITGDWMVNENWTLEASYSLLDLQLRRYDTSAFDLETAEDITPHHQIYLGSKWDINDAWSLNAAAYYTDEVPAYGLDDHVSLDLNLEWRVNDKLRFNLVGQNLIDDAHRKFSNPTSQNATEIETTIFGKITWEF